MCGVFITESVQATKKKKEKKIRWQVAGGRCVDFGSKEWVGIWKAAGMKGCIT